MLSSIQKRCTLLKFFLRKAHRWLGIIAAAQLLIWTASGLFFSITPINDIRGAGLIEQPAAFMLGHTQMISPSALARQHPKLSTLRVTDFQIKQRLNTPVYLVQLEGEWLAFNAETGEQMAPLSEEEAMTVASNNSRLAVQSAVWIGLAAPGTEYRGGELPAWRIEMEGPEQANLWIGANSGQINAIRTNKWRLYDFLWSLHIMDYRGRENFNSWLLRMFALLGLISITSGILLYFISRQKKKRLLNDKTLKTH